MSKDFDGYLAQAVQFYGNRALAQLAKSGEESVPFSMLEKELNLPSKDLLSVVEYLGDKGYLVIREHEMSVSITPAGKEQAKEPA